MQRTQISPYHTVYQSIAAFKLVLKFVDPAKIRRRYSDIDWIFFGIQTAHAVEMISNIELLRGFVVADI